jgi:hypothetical protein
MKNNPAKELNTLSIIDSNVAAADASLVGGIFGFFTNEAAHEYLEHTGHFYLFPLAAIASLVRAGLSIREAHLERKRSAIARAAIESVAAVAITTAVVGGLVAATVFSVVAPAIFTATLGLKSVYNGVASIYYGFKAAVNNDLEKKTAYKNKAIGHAKASLITGMFAITVGLVMLAAKPVFAFMGIIAGVLGTIMGVHNGYKQYKQRKLITAPLNNIANSDATISQRLGHTPTPSNDLSKNDDLDNNNQIKRSRVYSIYAKPELKKPLLAESYANSESISAALRLI